MQKNYSELHAPVLLAEVLDLTAPQPGETVLDATLGLGGHSAALLSVVGPSGRLIGLDADQRNLTLAKERFSGQVNFTSYHTNFARLIEFVPEKSVDLILFDLGVSSPHFDESDRGFSFRSAGPLDMRLDTSSSLTAAEIVNHWSELEITQILRDYGEIHTAAKVARQIVTARKQAKLTTTTELAAQVSAQSLLPQVFQALRIAVNDELQKLQMGLAAALRSLRSHGRLAVISFHSLEDRIVKEFLRTESRDCLCPSSLPHCVCGHTRSLQILTKKPITPGKAELEANPRSRSAKLRIARKL